MARVNSSPGFPELQVLGGGDEEEAAVVEVGGEEGEHSRHLSDHSVCRQNSSFLKQSYSSLLLNQNME